jgi:allantoicase
MHNSPDHTGRRTEDDDTPPFTRLADLASARVGGRAMASSDDFFAPRANLLKPEPAVFVAGKFTARGKWMDGWESRRKRTPGHDWCVVALGMRGRIRGVDVDTSFFVGNHPPRCSIEAIDAARPLSQAVEGREGPPWTTILHESPLGAGSHNYFAIDPTATIDAPAGGPDGGAAWTHLRLNIFPDGGVARFRAYGEVVVDWPRVARSGRPIDLASIVNGGLVVGASDMHFGARDNLIMPGRAANMGDGWETRRRRGPGHDWAVVRLGAPGLLTRVEIDTNHFKGNYPDSASLEGCLAGSAEIGAPDEATWFPILPQTKLRADHRHRFARELLSSGPASHVRLNIYPDGGVSRLRIHGTLAPA